MINLVSTRCSNGDHALLQRWYADHVQLLLASPQLISAQLHRFKPALLGTHADYVCAYEFSAPTEFAQFESGSEKARATELTNAAAGRESIEIVQRQQYARVLHRRFADTPLASPHGLWMQLKIEQTDPESCTRWLGDFVQKGCSALPVHNAQVLAGVSSPPLWVLHIGMSACDPEPAAELLQTLLAQEARYGQAPDEWQLQWMAASAPVMQWLR